MRKILTAFVVASFAIAHLIVQVEVAFGQSSEVQTEEDLRRTIRNNGYELLAYGLKQQALVVAKLNSLFFRDRSGYRRMAVIVVDDWKSNEKYYRNIAGFASIDNAIAQHKKILEQWDLPGTTEESRAVYANLSHTHLELFVVQERASSISPR
jgi:hypothetical protein